MTPTTKRAPPPGVSGARGTVYLVMKRLRLFCSGHYFFLHGDTGSAPLRGDERVSEPQGEREREGYRHTCNATDPPTEAPGGGRGEAEKTAWLS